MTAKRYYQNYRVCPLEATLIPAFLKVTVPITPCVTLTLDKRIDGTEAVTVRTAKVQRLQDIIDENPDKVLCLWDLLSACPPRPPVSDRWLCTTQLLCDHPTAKWDDPAGHPRPPGIRVCGIEGGSWFEQSQGRVDGDHLTVVREVGVERSVERESGGRSVECFVYLGTLEDGGAWPGQTGNKLVDIAYALDWT